MKSRWNHTPFDEASSNGHKDIAELLLEGIRQWEEDELKVDFESDEDDIAASDHAICSNVVTQPLNDISNINLSNRIELLVLSIINKRVNVNNTFKRINCRNYC